MYPVKAIVYIYIHVQVSQKRKVLLRDFIQTKLHASTLSYVRKMTSRTRVYEGIIRHQNSVKTRQEKQLIKLKTDLSVMLEEEAKMDIEICRTKMEVSQTSGVIKQYEGENDRIYEIKHRQEQASLQASDKEKENEKSVKSVNNDLRIGIEESLELDAEIRFLKIKLDTCSREDRPFSIGKARHRLGIKGVTKLSKLDENAMNMSSDDAIGRQSHRYSLFEVPTTTLNSIPRRFSKV